MEYAKAQKKIKQTVKDSPLPSYDQGEQEKLDQVFYFFINFMNLVLQSFVY